MKGLNCVAIRSAEINGLKERGVAFTGPAADSTPCLRARQAQYPLKYLKSGDRSFAPMSAETSSLAIATLEEGLRDLRNAWQGITSTFEDEIKRRVYVRDATFEQLKAPYYEDMKLLKTVIEESRKRPNFLSKTVTAVLSQRIQPKIDQLGFRMCTISWGSSPHHIDYTVINRVLALCKVESITQAGPSSQTSASESKRNARCSGAVHSSNPMTGRGGGDKNSTRIQEQDAQEEVF